MVSNVHYLILKLAVTYYIYRIMISAKYPLVTVFHAEIYLDHHIY